MSHPLDPETILRKPLMAHLASASADGPRHSPVWFLWEDGAVWLISSRDESMAERLRAEPRCAIGIVEFNAEAGILRHVGIRGRAEVLPVDTARRDRLLAKYIGADSAAWPAGFKAQVIDTIDTLIRIEPESTIAREQSYFSPNSPLGYE